MILYVKVSKKYKIKFNSLNSLKFLEKTRLKILLIKSHIIDEFTNSIFFKTNF